MDQNNNHLLANVLCHLDMCELVVHYQSPLLPYHKYLKNCEVILTISSYYQLPRSVDFKTLLSDYFNQYILIKHTSIPTQFDELLRLVIKYNYGEIVDRILTSKIMLYSTAVDVYKHLITWNITKFMAIPSISIRNIERLIDWLFQSGQSDDIIMKVVTGRKYPNWAFDHRRNKYHRELPGIPTENIYTPVTTDHRQQVIKYGDAISWIENHIKCDELNIHFESVIDHDKCNYLDSIGYSTKELLTCGDIYSLDWQIARLDMKLVYNGDDITASYTCDPIYIGPLQIMTSGDHRSLYTTYNLHPSMYLHLLSKCDDAPNVIDLE